MHLVFLNQYYPPDVAPTGVMLEGVVTELAKEGHKVTVLCASGGYARSKRGDDGGESKEQPMYGAQASQSTANGQQPTVIRIGATQFGRGSFVGKLLDYASYYFGVAWKLLWLRPRPDRIVALTTPPYLSVLARALSKIRGGDHAHWVMDLYPDVMAAHGMLGERHPLHRVLAVLARWGFGGRRIAAVVTLGPDMADRVARRVGGASAVSWVPLWGLAEETGEASAETVAELRRARGWSDTDLVVMYSGNMGLGHGFDEILEVAGDVGEEREKGALVPGSSFTEAHAVRDDDPCALVKEGHLSSRSEPQVPQDNQEPTTKNESTSSFPPFRFVFFGSGKRKAEVEAYARAHPAAGIEIHGYVPMEILGAHLRSADVHLASLKPEWTGTMVPSKLQGIFAAGRPVVFLGDKRSSIGRWVAESGAGWVVAPGDVAGLRACLAEARDPGERARRGGAARAYALEQFNRRINTDKLAGLFGVASGQADRGHERHGVSRRIPMNRK